MRRALLLSIGALLVAGCPAGDDDDSAGVAVPELEDPRAFSTDPYWSAYWPCNVTTGTVALHASLDSLDLDYGAIIFWVFEQDSVNWVGDFPQTGELAFRGYNIHSIGFPQEFQLCMPPGRYTVRAVQDRDHNGRVCQPGELWGSIDIVHPVSNKDDALLVLDQVLSEEDGCPEETTDLPVSSD